MKFKNILLIEDDTFIAELYMRALEKSGYTARNIVKGPEGLEEAKTGKYDLLLLDIMIPDLDGLEILKQLRGEDGNQLPNTHIIITTNLDQDDQTKADLEPLIDGYIVKADVTPKKLVNYIQELESSLS